jgi:hypothetical protein
MASFDPIPQARVVRSAGQLVTPPRAPRSPRAPQSPSRFQENARIVLTYAVGLWPLTGVLILAIGLMWAAAMSGSP